MSRPLQRTGQGPTEWDGNPPDDVQLWRRTAVEVPTHLLMRRLDQLTKAVEQMGDKLQELLRDRTKCG